MSWREIDIIKYFYLNYFCKNIIRQGTGKIMPYKNTLIDLAKTSKIYIKDGNLEIGVNKLKGSRAETYIRLREGAVWKAQEHCEISYGSTIEILKEASLESQYFTMNSFSTIVAGESVTIENDVMIARNVIIFDSDFHAIQYGEEKAEYSKPVKIGNHVWIAANSMILKGVQIEEGSVISANTVVTKKVKGNILIGNKRELSIFKENVKWSR